MNGYKLLFMYFFFLVEFSLALLFFFISVWVLNVVRRLLFLDFVLFGTFLREKFEGKSISRSIVFSDYDCLVIKRYPNICNKTIKYTIASARSWHNMQNYGCTVSDCTGTEPSLIKIRFKFQIFLKKLYIHLSNL